MEDFKTPRSWTSQDLLWIRKQIYTTPKILHPDASFSVDGAKLFKYFVGELNENVTKVVLVKRNARGYAQGFVVHLTISFDPFKNVVNLLKFAVYLNIFSLNLIIKNLSTLPTLENKKDILSNKYTIIVIDIQIIFM